MVDAHLMHALDHNWHPVFNLVCRFAHQLADTLMQPLPDVMDMQGLCAWISVNCLQCQVQASKLCEVSNDQ